MSGGTQAAVLFFSNNHAIWASRILKKNTLDHAMIPVPRSLSSDCGYCVRIEAADARAVEELLRSSGVEFDRIEPIP